jgi:hypothetical protein
MTCAEHEIAVRMNLRPSGLNALVCHRTPLEQRCFSIPQDTWLVESLFTIVPQILNRKPGQARRGQPVGPWVSRLLMTF